MKPASNINELEAKIQTLERVNFDLKLQLHYLNKKYANATNPGTSGPEVNVHVLEDRSMDILSLREELEYAKKRILELESELLQVQLLRDRERAEYQKALQHRPPEIMEENRRREREVSLAIAEHDAILIAKLRGEVDGLAAELESSKKHVETLKEQLESKDSEILTLQDAKKRLETEVDKLEDEIRSNGKRGALVPSNTAGGGAGGNGSNNPMIFSATSDGQQTSIIINSSMFAAGGTIGGGMMPGPSPTSFMIQGGAQNVAQAMHGAGYTNSNMPSRPTPMLGYTDGSAGAEQLKLENAQLRQRLTMLESTLHTQQGVIDNMQRSSLEMHKVEKEEAARLAGELDRCMGEREALRLRLNKVEIDYEMACRRIKDLGFSFTSPPFNDQDSVGNTTNMEPLSTPLSYSQSNRLAGFGGGQNSAQLQVLYEKTSAQLQAARIEIENYEKTVEMYRQREEELLYALEGVVQRCQVLENQVQDMSRYRR